MSRGAGLIFGNDDEGDVESARERLALRRLHRNRVLDVEQLAAERRAIDVESALLDELLHRHARLLVGVAELLDQGSHSPRGYTMPKSKSRRRVHYAHPGGFTVAIVAGTKKIRGKPVVLPDWWLNDVRRRFDEMKAAKEITKVSLAASLSEAIGRPLAWDHKAVERFLANEHTTYEMMWAFLKLWPSLLPCHFMARTRDDAERIIDALRRGQANPEWRNRYLEIDANFLEIAAPVLDQTAGVSSSNEVPDAVRRQTRRRPRSVG